MPPLTPSLSCFRLSQPPDCGLAQCPRRAPAAMQILFSGASLGCAGENRRFCCCLQYMLKKDFVDNHSCMLSPNAHLSSEGLLTTTWRKKAFFLGPQRATAVVTRRRAGPSLMLPETPEQSRETRKPQGHFPPLWSTVTVVQRISCSASAGKTMQPRHEKRRKSNMFPSRVQLNTRRF